MRRSLTLERALVVGCLAGLLLHGARPRWQTVPTRMIRVRYTGEMLRPVMTGPDRLQPVPRIPRARLVDVNRADIRDPCGDYNTATLWRVDFRGADLGEADLRQSDIRQCDFRGANLEHADLTDATFDAATRWPVGFDPVEHGAQSL